MRRFLIWSFVLMGLGGMMGAGVAALAYWHFSRDLPDHQQLIAYQPATLSRVHAGDGRVLAEWATERRLFVPIEAMPRLVIRAILAAEDKSFHSHSGISLPDIARAAFVNLMNLGQDRRPIGASTITQQVAKNFLLGNEVSIARKAREAILAMRIEEVLTKDRILELYLNEIYLGAGTYGVASASLFYFNKSLDELTIAEAAFLAALPKAPNNYHPVRFPEAARARRDWVLGRMQEDGWITAADVEAGRAQAVIMRARGEADTTRADYFAEEVRRELVARYGEAEVYRGGLSVRTTLSPRMQEIADRALRTGLVAYDRRHGWRAPLGRLDVGPGWERRLAQFQRPPGLSPWLPALILALDDQMAEVGLANGTRGRIPFSEMQWARRTIENQRLGPVLRKPADVLHVGDVVAVEAIDAPVGARDQYYFTLRQIPNLGGAVVALDPHTGRVLAMSGGWSFEASQFNRATQAQRQPGSAFKPFVYLPALDNGFTPSSLVLDAAFVIDQGPGQGLWKPANYSRNFFGPSPLRVGIEQSRNLMTVRLAEAIGIEKVADYARRFGVIDQMPHQLSMALGAGETTLMRLATGYAMLVNGGYKITPTLIDRVQDRHGRTVFKHDARVCPGCVPAAADGAIPELPEARPRVVDAATAYQMVSMLQGVVDRGTARRVKDLNRPLAGKTGTTNASNDVWFIGFSPDLVVGVFVGFDNPRTLGPNETGSSVAVPIFRDVMAEALAGEAKAPFRMASGIRLYRVNLTTGLLAGAADREAILEAFKSGTSPSATPQVLGGGNPAASPALAVPIPASEKDGIY